jgi:hypothetical protein
MLLNEMFSPIGAPKEDDREIDWLGDLKFFIDNENDMLTHHLFPAVKKHSRYIDHPKAYKIYIRPLEKCLEAYCKKFEIKDRNEKFPKESLTELAKKICEEQKKHLEDGDYDEIN